MKFKNKPKRIKALLMAGVTAVVAPIVLSACSKTSQDVVVVALTDPENPRWVKAKQELSTNIAKYKSKTDDLAYTVNASQSKSQSIQDNFVNTQINTGKVKAIVLGEITSGANIVNTASSKGIPLVAYDRLINGTQDYKYYATYDTTKVGVIQGLHLAAFLVGKTDGAFKNEEEFKKYLTDKKTELESMTDDKWFIPVQGDPADNNAKIFFDGAMKILNQLTTATKGKIKAIFNFSSGDELYVKSGDTYTTNDSAFNKVANAGWNYDEAKKSLETKLAAAGENKSKLKGILAANDGMADAAIKALDQKGFEIKDKIYITGQDANDYGLKHIKDGKQGMTIHKPDNDLSLVVAAIVDELIRNKDIEPTTLATNIKTHEFLKTKSFFSNVEFRSATDAKNIYKPKFELNSANDATDKMQDTKTKTPTGKLIYEATTAINTWVLEPIAMTAADVK